MKDRIKKLVGEVPDFPKQGILFYDITSVLSDPEGLDLAIKAMTEPWMDSGITKVVCIESRGFIFGVPVAQALGVGAVLVRKPGKLPRKTRIAEYSLEYGTDRIEMHEDDLGPDDRVLVIDDLLATGGTMEAAVHLVRDAGAEVAGVGFLIELDFLGGRAKLDSVPRVETVLHYTE
jgi:adenine phosphoribosyltransferase